jgi:serine/threonine-protein kinase
LRPTEVTEVLPEAPSRTGTDPYKLPADLLAGRYRLEAELGRGAMGVAYRAVDLRMRRPVVIKMLHPALTNHLGVSRFRSEIQIAANLTHPNIVVVHEAGEANHRLYYVMEYLEGETLRSRLEREKQLSIADTISIAHDVALGLQYAHDHGVIHRDVKPDNILLTDGRAVILDFGLARVLDRADVDRLTESGISVGTPHYLSPEQAAAERNVQPQTDQYALACVVYEMLIGEPPFTGPTAAAIAQRHIAEHAVPPRTRRWTVPRAVDVAVMRALRKVPTDRYANIRDLASALHASPRRWFLPALPAGWFFASFVAVAALAVSIGWPGSRRNWTLVRTGATAVDSNQLAIAPFLIAGVDTVWREGLVDLMSQTLDGAGPLRSLSTREAVRSPGRVADIASAVQFGRATGSGLVLFGRLLGVTDSVRLTATLVDVRNQVSVGDVDLEEQANRVDRLVDSASVRLLRNLGAARPIGAVPTTSIGSRSMPALKAFLRGEQLYRQNQWVRAETLYLRAVQADDKFALAYHRLRNVMRGTRDEMDPESFRYALLAGALNHGLSPRDSLLVTADSLYAVIALGGRSPNWWSMVQRRIAILRQATTSYPRDPEGWLELGEALMHYREWAGVSPGQIFAPFRRSIELDSTWVPAYYHAIELGARLLSPADEFRIVERNHRVAPTDETVANLYQLLDSSATPASRASRLAALDPNALTDVAYLLRFRPDSEELAVDAARAMDFRRGARVTPGDSANIERWRFRVLAIRGHLYEARKVVGSGLGPWSPEDFIELALLGVVSSKEADAMIHGWANGANAVRASLALPWLLAQSDSDGVRRIRQRFQRNRSAATRDSVSPAAYAASVAEAYLALVRRDTAAAIRAFDAVPDSLCGSECTRHRIQRSVLLREHGRAADARHLLETRPPSADDASLLEIVWLNEHARVLSALGLTAAATAEQSLITRYWQHADVDVGRLR